jgi:hypothetical protein
MYDSFLNAATGEQIRDEISKTMSTFSNQFDEFPDQV